MDNFFFGKPIVLKPSKEDDKCNNGCSFEISTNYVREFSKGKSFDFHIWNSKDCYNNDEFVIDFVKYDQKLWAALKTSINEVPYKGSEYWEIIAEGVANVEFRQVENQIQWKYEDEIEWRYLFELCSVSESEIKEMLKDLNIQHLNSYDSELLEHSTNAVQNKTLYNKFKDVDDKIDVVTQEVDLCKTTISENTQNIKELEDSSVTKSQLTALSEDLANKAEKSEIPTKMSQLEQDVEIGSSNGVPVVSSTKELGGLDVPLGTVASVAKEGYEITEELTKHENDRIPFKGIKFISDNFFSTSQKEPVTIQFGIVDEIIWQAVNNYVAIYCYINDKTYCLYNSTVSSEIDVEQLNAVNSILEKSSTYITDVRSADQEAITQLNSFLHGVFEYPSEVSTYVKSEKGLDLPTPRKFSDFGEHPELFPKEERVVKNINILATYSPPALLTFETIGGTIITISLGIYDAGGHYIQYGDEEYRPLSEQELDALNALLESTTVYYTAVTLIGLSPSDMNRVISADFPLPNEVEIKTWKRVYTEKDAISLSDVDSICINVFSGGYYYYSDEGIGEFDDYYSEEGIGEFAEEEQEE